MDWVIMLKTKVVRNELWNVDKEIRKYIYYKYIKYILNILRKYI